MLVIINKWIQWDVFNINFKDLSNTSLLKIVIEFIGVMWRKGNPSTMLVGMQTCAATVENSMDFPQKTKNGTAF